MWTTEMERKKIVEVRRTKKKNGKEAWNVEGGAAKKDGNSQKREVLRQI